MLHCFRIFRSSDSLFSFSTVVGTFLFFLSFFSRDKVEHFCDHHATSKTVVSRLNLLASSLYLLRCSSSSFICWFARLVKFSVRIGIDAIMSPDQCPPVKGGTENGVSRRDQPEIFPPKGNYLRLTPPNLPVSPLIAHSMHGTFLILVVSLLCPNSVLTHFFGLKINKKNPKIFTDFLLSQRQLTSR